MRRGKAVFPYLLVALSSCLSAATGAQTADNFPTRPVTIIANVAAGGPVDVEARLHAKKLAEMLGQPFLVDYKPGAGGNIGGNYVAKAKPDGYTVLVATASFTVLPAFMSQPFDVEKDFEPITLTSLKTSLLVLSPSFPPRNVKEYIAYAKANSGKVNFGWVGPSVVAGAWLHSATGISVTFVPYKGIGTIMTDLMAGRLDVAAGALPVVLPFIKAGKMRPLGVTNDKRSTLLPDVPTIMEQGVPEFNYQNWLGYLAPAQTPPAIVGKLSQNFARVVISADIVAVLEGDGSAPWGSTPEEFRQLIATEVARWRKIAKETGFKLEG